MEHPITSVSSFNFEAEMFVLHSTLRTHNIASIDTEFPRLIRSTPRQADQFACYEDVKFNVARSILIQVGITLSDEEGHVGGTWQFNLACDDVAVDYVNCLRAVHGGVQFVRPPWMKVGVPRAAFSERFRELLDGSHGEVKWVMFHGLYDLAHLVPLLMWRPLPESVLEFVELVGRQFGRVYDIKSMAGSYTQMFGNTEYLGLEKLAAMVGVKRVGRAHQAGSDSLVTAGVFNRFTTRVCGLLGGPREDALEGFIYGLSVRVVCPRSVIHRRRPFKLVLNRSHELQADTYPQPYTLVAM